MQVRELEERERVKGAVTKQGNKEEKGARAAERDTRRVSTRAYIDESSPSVVDKGLNSRRKNKLDTRTTGRVTTRWLSWFVSERLNRSKSREEILKRLAPEERER